MSHVGDASSWLLDTTIDGPPLSEGAPVLVLAHSLGSSSVMWEEVVDTLSEAFTIIRYNLPGHGGAPCAPLDRPCTMDDILGALQRTLAELDVRQYHLAGLSFGGATALAAGIAHLPGLSSITVMSSGPVNAPLDQWPDKIDTVRTQGTSALIDATFKRWFTDDAEVTHPATYSAIREAFLGCDDEGYAQVCEVLGSTDMSEQVSAIDNPVLLISAENDGALPWEKADDLAAAITRGGSDVTVLRLAEVKHMSAVERPQEVARALREFIES